MSESGGRAPGTLAALLLSCHPVPTVAVTALATALVAAAGNDARTTAVAGGAVLAGQLSIGWCNDLVDADRDAAVGRTDKPVAAGRISRPLMTVATALALAGTVLLSALLGWRSGIAALVFVAAGWGYNLGLKSTPWSVVPYAVGFGVLPGMATLALPDHPLPPWWAVAAGALLGVGAHFANVLPDLRDDEATGVRGLPHRVGALGSAVTAVVAELAAVLVVALGPAGAVSAAGLAGTALAVAVAATGLGLARRRPGSDAVFFATMAVAAIAVGLFSCGCARGGAAT